VDAIKERVAILNIPVKIDTGQKSDCGLTLSFTGIASRGNGNVAFLISKDILNDMAEDETAYRKWMAKISERVQQEKELRNHGVNLLSPSESSVTGSFRERFLFHIASRYAANLGGEN
jgi:hypothetical protein